MNNGAGPSLILDFGLFDKMDRNWAFVATVQHYIYSFRIFRRKAKDERRLEQKSWTKKSSEQKNEKKNQNILT